jgi:histone H3/H4
LKGKKKRERKGVNKWQKNHIIIAEFSRISNKLGQRRRRIKSSNS